MTKETKKQSAASTSDVEDVNSCQLIRSPNFERICGSGEPCSIGIDEAGRGPVLGPMVYGVAVMPLASDQTLREHGVGDSKQLTEDKRDELFALFNEADCSVVAWAVRVISPAHLSRVMQQRVKYSLNDESHDSCIGLIQLCIDAGVKINGVFVDTVGPPETYQAKLERRFPALTITVSKKADSIYTVVGAASIAAKVTRDQRVRSWQFPENAAVADTVVVAETGFGSGYPGDPATKQFISGCTDDVFGYPSLVRFDWQTAKTMIEAKCVSVTWLDGGLHPSILHLEDDDGATTGTSSIMKFFGAAAKSDNETKENMKPVLPQRHSFFIDKSLKNVNCF